MEGFFGHLAQALDEIGFTDQRRSEKLLRRLRRLFIVRRPTARRSIYCGGILSAAQGASRCAASVPRPD